jgi:hypothetical protein
MFELVQERWPVLAAQVASGLRSADEPALAELWPGVHIVERCRCQDDFCQSGPEYRRLADKHGVRLSVGRRGQCWDNAVAESFFATIKTELLDRRPWPTRAAAHKAIFNWIKGWYNTRRRHSTLDYLSPATYEARINQQPDLRRVA